MKLSIVIPSYLEEENLRILLPRIIHTSNQLNITYEILVIDTCEPLDNTKFAADEYEVTYINRRNGNSYGDAVRTGIEEAKGEYILFMDADGSHSPEIISDLYYNIPDNDIVIASRYIEGGGSDNSKILVFMSLVVNRIYSIVFGMKIKDISNSFKIYNSKLLKQLSLRCNNFDIVEEILIKVVKRNKDISIKEIPYLFKERMFGKTKRNLFDFMLTYIITLLKLKFMK